MPLYIVATPIGNLEDITVRALRLLAEADIIASEDTRKTGRMLRRHNISTAAKGHDGPKLMSCYDQNEAKRAGSIARFVAEGKTVALVSNAGTPSISDPGYRVVRRCLDDGLEVITVPGPCAAVAALAASGLPTHSFHFAGFLSRKGGKRRKALAQLGELDATVVLYESPFRVVKLLKAVREVLGERRVCIAREITKKFEEFLRGKPSELIDHFEETPPKGEFVVMIAPDTGRD